jgi:hypothetical protein
MYCVQYIMHVVHLSGISKLRLLEREENSRSDPSANYCERCYAHCEHLEVHHNKYSRGGWGTADVLTCCSALCSGCHRYVGGYSKFDPLEEVLNRREEYRRNMGLI